uniref:AB hydrolase-1 domain-containing protein n=1 Tax=Oryza barthii TaxID=65489 RepID=A0A0D3EYC7_9ORYZ
MEGSSSSSKHFILVHGLCHGAWCWYKVVTMLRSEGHHVTALDLAASGVHPARIDESRPLLDAVAVAPAGERLILVGHSFGGLSIALAMERFLDKIAVAVFAASSMPCVGKHMGIVREDLTLAKLLMTPGSQFQDDPMMKDDKLLTSANYGSVKRVCLIGMEDDIKELHRYLITLSPGTEVEEIAGADHNIMCSKPRELCDLLAKISSKYD